MMSNIMIVRNMSRINCNSFSLRIESFSNNFKNRNVLKCTVVIFLRFNKCMTKGTATSGISQRKIGNRKLSGYLLMLIVYPLQVV